MSFSVYIFFYCLRACAAAAAGKGHDFSLKFFFFVSGFQRGKKKDSAGGKLVETRGRVSTRKVLLIKL
jgi:hypothetical protein